MKSSPSPGCSQGMNIWKVDPPAIEKKIAQTSLGAPGAWCAASFRVASLSMSKNACRSAIVALRKLYYVDADGVMFKEVERR